MSPAGGPKTIVDIRIIRVGVDGRACSMSEDNMHKFQCGFRGIRLCSITLVHMMMWPGPGWFLGLDLTEHTDGNHSQDGTCGQSTDCEDLFACTVPEYHFGGRIFSIQRFERSKPIVSIKY